jgi:peroxiredoxin
MKHLAMTALALWLTWLAPAVQAADDAIFTDFADQPRSIESYAGGGKWLVVMIWASDCSVCNREMGQYVQFYQAHKDKDATVLGISIDGQAKKAAAQAFIERHALPFPNLLAEPEAAVLYYVMHTQASFGGTPSFLIYAPDGQLTAAQAGAVPPQLIADFIADNSQTAKAD